MMKKKPKSFVTQTYSQIRLRQNKTKKKKNVNRKIIFDRRSSKRE